MSDARDAVAQAISKVRDLAATRIVRKDDLEAALAALAVDRGKVVAAGDAPEVLALLAELDAKRDTLSQDLAAANADIAAARQEITDLKRLGAKGDMAAIAALTASDPVIRTLEENALDNARGHLANLEAQVRLGDELGATPVAPASSAASSDADALAEFQRRRASRNAPTPPAEEKPDAPPAPPKKTM